MDDLKKLQRKIQKRTKSDPAHDFSHIMRVYYNAKKIATREKINPRLVLTAVLLHDVISFRKSGKRSKSSLIKSAKEATKILSKYNYTRSEIKIISMQ